MASLLPTVPRVVFSIIEPISLVAGFAGAMLDTPWFVSEQIPQAEPFDVHKTSIVLAWQLGNLYLLMAFMGVAILYGTSELKVVRNYLFVLWLGDIGHVGFSCYGMGMERLMRPREWNAIASGNITFTVFLFLMRSTYFLGFWGTSKAAVSSTKKTL
ncbi:hypothetical protein N3K66_000604 [Trichothecium roseum]|uniref:Uncharacterized protein n=1 Tax=Trichothecium roseum TaxID=47278 RepID=A0ACC0VCC7_9HYPO|nr:hypothetical protein N3K66_000604 [Trichothecium roseum]